MEISSPISLQQIKRIKNRFEQKQIKKKFAEQRKRRGGFLVILISVVSDLQALGRQNCGVCRYETDLNLSAADSDDRHPASDI